MELSWKLTSNTDEQNTLFKDSGSVYDIDVFLCSCGHYEFITRNKFDEIEYFNGIVTENERLKTLKKEILENN